MDLVERFRARYSFPLDDFQLEAIRAIQSDQSVIVSAPTGAGKTLVAEFAILAALESGTRLAYTTPLKALSNQKFGDFQRAYGEDKVGILTGDVKVNPHAPIVVMTTEILRNALYGSGFENLRYIVLDECHYMGDEGRGTVWEEIIVAAPRDVLLVGLSATVANVKEIADWISIVHRPILPIFHPHRPVPLAYVIASSRRPSGSRKKRPVAIPWSRSLHSTPASSRRRLIASRSASSTRTATWSPGPPRSWKAKPPAPTYAITGCPSLRTSRAPSTDS